MIPSGKYEFWWLMTTGEFPCPKLNDYKTPSGYIQIVGTNRYGKVIREVESRIIMEEWLCRKLEKLELIHHINGIRTDNRLENFLICTSKEHLTVLHAGSRGRKKGFHHSLQTRKKISEHHRSRGGVRRDCHAAQRELWEIGQRLGEK